MKLHFVGTGGGRFCLSTQKRRTGGFMIESEDYDLYVDPGPGALAYAREMHLPLDELDGVFVSHGHLDHYGDAEAIIQAMTDGCTRPGGELVANPTVLEGDDTFQQAVNDYHQHAVEHVVDTDADEHPLLSFFETAHKDIQTTGFLMELPERTVAYLPDAEYRRSLPGYVADADLLIINAPRPHDREWEGHMNLEDALRIARESGVSRTVVQHFGKAFTDQFEEEREWLEDERGDTRIMLADDGLELQVEKDDQLTRFLE